MFEALISAVKVTYTPSPSLPRIKEIQAVFAQRPPRIAFSKRVLCKAALPLTRLRVARVGCWFIDIPATSSTSCKAELERKFGWPYGKNDDGYSRFGFLNPIDDHMTARFMYCKLLSDLWQKIFTFSIIRNPWDRYLSLWHWSMGIQRTIAPWKSAKAFFKQESIRKLSNSRVYKPACDYLLDDSGELMVDFVAQYENRQKDMAYIGNRIGCPELGTLHIAKRKSLLDRYHYSEYYDTELCDIVAEVSRWEIEKYGYSFAP